MLETLIHSKTAGQAPGEDSVPEEGGEEEEPQDSSTTTQEIPTSTASIMEEDTAPKGAQRQKEHGKNPTRESTDEHCILDASQFRPNFWQPQFANPQSSSVPVQQFPQSQLAWQPLQQFFPHSQAIQSIQQPQPIREILPPPPESSLRPQSSSGPQNSKALPSFGTIMPITGGSAMEFETKKQRNNYFRSLNTIINDGPAARPEWAKVPIIFTEEDFRLKSAIHNDAKVIEVNIAGWVIGKILVDNRSSADILFLKTFEKMNLSQHMLDPPEYPL
jgi:hypothetical protein